MSRSILTATVLLASVALAGCSSSPAPASTFKVTGAVVLSVDVTHPGPQLSDDNGDLVPPEAGAACEGGGLHADIAEGAQVVVRDGGGKPVAVGELSGGVVQESNCSFALTVEGVPTRRPFYTLEVPHRSQNHYTAAKIQRPMLINLR